MTWGAPGAPQTPRTLAIAPAEPGRCSSHGAFSLHVDRDRVDDFQAECVEVLQAARMVGQQAQACEAEIAQDLTADPRVALVHRLRARRVRDPFLRGIRSQID